MGARVVTIGGTGLYQNYLSAGLISIDNPSDIANFQVSVTIPWCPGMLADFSNIRFAQTDDTVITAYRFSYTAMEQAVFWLKIPSANQHEIYFFFDNGEPNTSLLTTGANIFNQFNQFASSGTNLENTVDNNGNERHVWYDKAQNDYTAAYTLTGTPTWASGAYTLDDGEKMIRALASTDTTGKWEWVISFETAWASDQSSKHYFGATSYLDVQRHDDVANEIYLALVVNGSTVIAATDTTVTLADSTYARVTLTYDGTNYQMYWADVAVGSATAGSAPTTPSIGLLATVSQVKCIDLSFSPNVAHTDPFTADTESRYMQLVSADGTTYVAAAAGDVVVDTGNAKITLSSADDYSIIATGKSYNYGSGEYEFAFDNNNDGGGGSDNCGANFAYQDSANYYRVYILDNTAGTETLRIVKRVAGSQTTIADYDVSAIYTRGNKTWVKIQWDAQRGVIYTYVRDDAGTYTTAPLSTGYSAQFSYGKFGYRCGVDTPGAGNLNVDFYPMTIRAKLLVGETNVPATETGFTFTPAGIGQFSTTGTWTFAGVTLTCSGAGDAIVPFQTKIGVHTFTPTLANGTDYYYFGGYRVKFVASGGNQCVVTLETSAGVAQGTGSLTITTTAGAFANPIVITETSSSITITVSGATGSISSGTTTSTNAYPKFTVGTATCTFASYSFTGTRYYNAPMLVGEGQIGQYYDGSSTVNATRFTDDFNSNSIAEYTQVYRTWTADIANGIVGVSGTNALLRTNTKFGAGYRYIILDSTAVASSAYLLFGWDGTSDGAGTQYNSYSIRYAISTGYLYIYKYDGTGISTLLATSTGVYIGTGNTPYMLAAYWNPTTGRIVGYLYSISGTPLNSVSVTDTTFTSKNYDGVKFATTTFRLKGININAIESTSTNGVCRTHGSVSHGNLLSTGITAGYLMREYESTDPTLTEVARMPNPFAPRRVWTDGNRAEIVKATLGIQHSVKADMSAKVNMTTGIHHSVKGDISARVAMTIGIEHMVPKADITSWVTSQHFRRATIHRGIQDKYATASFWFDGQPDWWFYDKQIRYDMPDYLGTEYPVFIGEAPDSDDTLAPAGDEFVLKAVDPGANLSEPLSQDQLVMPSTTNPGEYIRDLLGGMFDWQKTSGIFPGMVQDVTGWGSTVTAFEKVFPEGTTKREAITFFEGQLNYIFDVRQKSYGGSYLPTGYFCDFTNIDSATVGLDLLSEVTFTYPSAFVGKPIQRKRSGTQKYNRIYIRCQALASSTWYEYEYLTPACAAGEERPKTYPPGSAVEKEIFTQADLNTRGAAYAAYYCGDIGDKITTWIVVLYDRPDIQRMQKVKFTGFSLGTEFDGVSMRVVDITYDHGIDDAGDPVNSTTIQIIPDADFQLQNQISRLDPGRYSKMEDMIRKKIIEMVGDEEAATVDTVVGDVITATTESGKVITTRK